MDIISMHLRDQLADVLQSASRKLRPEVYQGSLVTGHNCLQEMILGHWLCTLKVLLH